MILYVVTTLLTPKLEQEVPFRIKQGCGLCRSHQHLSRTQSLQGACLS